MTDRDFSSEQFANVDANTRLLLAAGLSRLSEDLTDKHPLLDIVRQIRTALEKETILTKVPEHVTFDGPELQEFLSFLGNSEYWTLYWESSEEEGYDLVGEVSVHGDISHFSVASGLIGTEAFVLAPDDAAFVEQLRDYVRMWAPWTSDELSVAVVELPVSWTALDGMIHDEHALEAYLGRIASSSDLSGVMARGARGDTHSNTDLEASEYAGVTTLAVDTRRKLDLLPKIIAEYETSLITPVRNEPV